MVKTVAIEEIVGLNVNRYGDDRFYRISDKLFKHRDYIEKNLYQRENERIVRRLLWRLYWMAMDLFGNIEFLTANGRCEIIR